jgi:hypothetical protein
LQAGVHAVHYPPDACSHTLYTEPLQGKLPSSFEIVDGWEGGDPNTRFPIRVWTQRYCTPPPPPPRTYATDTYTNRLCMGWVVQRAGRFVSMSHGSFGAENDKVITYTDRFFQGK